MRTLLIGLLIFSTSILAAPQLLDKVIIIVNDGMVLQSDIDYMMNIIKLSANNAGQPILNEKLFRNQILELLIRNTIICQIAPKIHINVTDQQIDDHITHIAAQHGLTVSQLQQKLAMYGISFTNYRYHVSQEILIRKVRYNEVKQRIKILPQEVDSLITQLNSQIGPNTNVSLSNIMIPLPQNNNLKKIQLAIQTVNKILLQLQQGTDFATLAITYSAAPNAFLGGKIGWRKMTELPTVFNQHLQHAQKGEIIGPIRYRSQFHIIQINDLNNDTRRILVKEVKTSHIFIKLSPFMNDEQAYAQIRHIEHQIKTGQISFAEAAKKYSQDLHTALRGGELGWKMLNYFEPTLRSSLMQLSQGEISKPIQSFGGWYIIKLEDIRQVDKTKVAKKNYAYRLLLNRKFNEEAQIWIKEQRASAYIKIMNDIHTQ